MKNQLKDLDYCLTIQMLSTGNKLFSEAQALLEQITKIPNKLPLLSQLNITEEPSSDNIQDICNQLREILSKKRIYIKKKKSLNIIGQLQQEIIDKELRRHTGFFVYEPTNLRKQNAVTSDLLELLEHFTISDINASVDIYSKKIQALIQVKSDSSVDTDTIFKAFFRCTNKSYHANNATFGFNGFTRQYELTALGKALLRAIQIADNLKKITGKLKGVPEEVFRTSINVHFSDFKRFCEHVGNISKYNILGKHNKHICLENKVLSEKFNRTYTTFTQMPKVARNYTNLRETADVTRFSLNFLLSSRVFDYRPLRKGLKPSLKDSKDQGPKMKYLEMYLDKASQYKFHNIKGVCFDPKNIKKALIATLYGARNSMIKKTLIEGLSITDKKKTHKYFLKSDLYKLITEIRTSRKSLYKDINSKSIRKMINCDLKRNSQGYVVSHFLSYMEKMFRKVSEAVIKEHNPKRIYFQVHDAIYLSKDDCITAEEKTRIQNICMSKFRLFINL